MKLNTGEDKESERNLAKAVRAYDAAIRACGNDPEKMSSFCSAQGEDLDTLYFAMVNAANAPASSSLARQDSPRGAYEPLTQEQIEQLRTLWANPLGGDSRFSILCNMAVNCLLYAEEINRLRSAPLPSVVAYRESGLAVQELENIANAKRHDRDHFQDDTEFANWARSRCQFTLEKIRVSAASPAARAMPDVIGGTPHERELARSALQIAARGEAQAGAVDSGSLPARAASATMDSPTPRTEAFNAQVGPTSSSDGRLERWRVFARQLERELAQAKADLVEVDEANTRLARQTQATPSAIAHKSVSPGTATPEYADTQGNFASPTTAITMTGGALEFAIKYFEAYGLSHLQYGEAWTGVGLASELRAIASATPRADLPATNNLLLDELIARDERLEAMVRKAVDSGDLSELRGWLKVRVGVRFVTDTRLGGD